MSGGSSPLAAPQTAGPLAPSCGLPARDASLVARARAFVACRPCMLGWAVYLAAAIVLVALYGSH